MQKIIQCIRSLIKRAKHSAALNDDGNYSVGQSTYFGKTENYEMIFPYGMSANPKENSLVLLVNVMGQEQNLAGFVNDPPNRFKDLMAGEVQIGNPDKKQSIKFAEDGTIIIETPESDVIVKSANDVKIDAANDVEVNCANELKINAQMSITIDSGSDVTLTASGDVTIDANELTIENDTIINGSLTVNGEITDTTGKQMSTIINNYNDHTHISASPGNPTGTTSDPV